MAAGVAYLRGNSVVEPDGSVTRLAAPPGTHVSATTEIADGYVFGADNGYVYLQAHNRSVRRVAAGQFVVSSDGRRLAVMGDTRVSVFALPSLFDLGTFQFPGATPGGPSVTAIRGDWVLLFDEDMPAQPPGVSVVWNLATHATVSFAASEPFAVGTDGSVLRRVLNPADVSCYDDTPLPALRLSSGGYCGGVDRVAGGVDAAALSNDGQWAAIAVSNRQSTVLVRIADLRAGRWNAVRLPASSGTPIYWDGSDVVIGGDHSYACNLAGRCDALAIPRDATIVPRLGVEG